MCRVFGTCRYSGTAWSSARRSEYQKDLPGRSPARKMLEDFVMLYWEPNRLTYLPEKEKHHGAS
jgi:hypothetical protein